MNEKINQEEQVNRCKTCIHWKNKQSELGYSGFTGFCVHPKFKFSVEKGRLIGVVDRENPINREKNGNPYHDVETLDAHSANGVKGSRYVLVTEEEFGCIYHQNPDKPEKHTD